MSWSQIAGIYISKGNINTPFHWQCDLIFSCIQRKKNIPDGTWLTQSHLKLDYGNFACATDSSRLGDWFYAENPGAVIHGFHDTQLNSSFLWLFRWSYMYSFDYWISCRQASITVSCNTFKAPWTNFQWVMSTFLTCTMSMMSRVGMSWWQGMSGWVDDWLAIISPVWQDGLITLYYMLFSM